MKQLSFFLGIFLLLFGSLGFAQSDATLDEKKQKSVIKYQNIQLKERGTISDKTIVYEITRKTMDDFKKMKFFWGDQELKPKTSVIVDKKALVGVLIDASGSMGRRGLRKLKKSILSQFDSLPKEDSLLIWSFADQLQNHIFKENGLTKRAKAKKAIQKFKTRGKWSRFYDSLPKVLNELKSKQTDSELPILIIYTDGIDEKSTTTYEETLKKIKQAQIPLVIFSVYGNKKPNQEVLEKWAAVSQGSFFREPKNSLLEKVNSYKKVLKVTFDKPIEITQKIEEEKSNWLLIGLIIFAVIIVLLVLNKRKAEKLEDLSDEDSIVNESVIETADDQKAVVLAGATVRGRTGDGTLVQRGASERNKRVQSKNQTDVSHTAATDDRLAGVQGAARTRAVSDRAAVARSGSRAPMRTAAGARVAAGASTQVDRTAGLRSGGSRADAIRNSTTSEQNTPTRTAGNRTAGVRAGAGNRTAGVRAGAGSRATGARAEAGSRATGARAEAGSRATGARAEAGSRATGARAEAGSRATGARVEAGSRATAVRAEAGSRADVTRGVARAGRGGRTQESSGSAREQVNVARTARDARSSQGRVTSARNVSDRTSSNRGATGRTDALQARTSGSRTAEARGAQNNQVATRGQGPIPRTASRTNAVRGQADTTQIADEGMLEQETQPPMSRAELLQAQRTGQLPQQSENEETLDNLEEIQEPEGLTRREIPGRRKVVAREIPGRGTAAPRNRLPTYRPGSGDKPQDNVPDSDLSAVANQRTATGRRSFDLTERNTGDRIEKKNP